MHEVETVLRRLHPDPTGTEVAQLTVEKTEWLEWVGMGRTEFQHSAIGQPCPFSA